MQIIYSIQHLFLLESSYQTGSALIHIFIFSFFSVFKSAGDSALCRSLLNCHTGQNRTVSSSAFASTKILQVSHARCSYLERVSSPTSFNHFPTSAPVLSSCRQQRIKISANCLFGQNDPTLVTQAVVLFSSTCGPPEALSLALTPLDIFCWASWLHIQHADTSGINLLIWVSSPVMSTYFSKVLHSIGFNGSLQ